MVVTGSALMSCLPHLASSHLFGCRMLTLTNTSEVGGLVGDQAWELVAACGMTARLMCRFPATTPSP